MFHFHSETLQSLAVSPCGRYAAAAADDDDGDGDDGDGVRFLTPLGQTEPEQSNKDEVGFTCTRVCSCVRRLLPACFELAPHLPPSVMCERRPRHRR